MGETSPNFSEKERKRGGEMRSCCQSCGKIRLSTCLIRKKVRLKKGDRRGSQSPEYVSGGGRERWSFVPRSARGGESYGEDSGTRRGQKEIR